jgi:DNA-binding NtrC family response regulator
MTTIASATPPALAPDERRASIAVVDDDSGFSGYLRTFLSLRGYEARSYTRGDEVVAAIRQGEPPDIVLLDVAMPGMDGIQTLKALKSARPELQVIMLSGREQANIIVEAVRLGAADYVVKPGDPEGLGEIALDAAIKQAIERNRLVTELTDLRRQLSVDQGEAFIGWGDSPAMRHVAMIIEQVADSDVTVLIRGESGVGKELVARAIHHRSTRHAKPFVKVNCAALPAELLESELFGHERGAFTGAATTRIGKFEQANLGTILLDEIGEMKPPLQAKLLHVLQDAEFTKLGSNKRINVDVRVLAATNRDLEQMMLRLLHRQVLAPLQPADPSAVARAAPDVHELRVAGQRARAREHDQAVRHPAGRVDDRARAHQAARGGRRGCRADRGAASRGRCPAADTAGRNARARR